MSKQLADDLIQMICKRSPLVADNIGLSLTFHELEYIYESIGEHFIKERVTGKRMSDMAVVLEFITGDFGGIGKAR